MPAYYIDLPGGVAPLAWDPRRGPLRERPDTRYFGAAFLAMEAALDDGDLDVYLTWNVERLPAYGEDVVAVVLGDEAGRIPRYADRVRAVFKAYGTRPATLGASPGLAGVVSVAQSAYRWSRWLPRAAKLRISSEARRKTGKPPAALITIPPGTYNQLDLPMRRIEDRSTDLFFAGSVEHGTRRQRVGSAKLQARREMLAAVRRLQQHRPELRAELRITPGFDASARSDAAAYSGRLMDAKLCLAPRGTSAETFRIFEGLRAGCVVVCQPVPAHWFYSGAPLVILERWHDLEATVVPLLRDPTALCDLHLRSLAWWRDRCSEAACGSFMAECLNRLSSN